ncbi:hypothetical protein FRC20_005708 [Serendipita sp. 405]|nr:hypothetical protein FRC20_005708 [Serendipita sp. 405]
MTFVRHVKLWASWSCCAFGESSPNLEPLRHPPTAAVSQTRACIPDKILMRESHSTFWSYATDVQIVAQHIWHSLIPYPEYRIPVTRYTIHNVFFPLIPLLMMGYLVRRPNTHIHRIALMPIAIWATLRASFGYVWVDEFYSPYNFGQGLFGLASVGKAIEYACVKEGRLKVGESTVGQADLPAVDAVTAKKPSVASTLGVNKTLSPVDARVIRSPSGVTLQYLPLSNGGLSPTGELRTAVRSPSGVTLAFRDTTRPASPTSKKAAGKTISKTVRTSHPLRGLADALEVIGSVRGIGWEFGKGLYIAPETRPLDRRGFLLSYLQFFILSFLTLDFIESMLKVLPGFSDGYRGSIFFVQALPSFLSRNTTLSPLVKEYPTEILLVFRYLVSTGITFAIGFGVIAGFNMVYSLLTVFCVGVLGHNPESWAFPLFDHPWRATSLADFWGRRWHQTLRQTFFIFGGYPLQYILSAITGIFTSNEKTKKNIGRMGLVLGTFTASGLFHGFAIYPMGKGGISSTGIIYFASQGVFVLVERGWSYITGKKVGGVLGRLWAYSIVIIGLEPCIDEWTSRGF